MDRSDLEQGALLVVRGLRLLLLKAQDNDQDHDINGPPKGASMPEEES